MKLAFACPFYGNTPPLVGDSFRANIINASEAGHQWIDDYSVSGTQHRQACEAMSFKAAHDKRIDAVFWTEHDCILAPMAVVQLCETLEKTPEADCVTGIVFRRCEPYNPMVAMLDPNYLTPEGYEEMKNSKDYNVRRSANLMTYEEARQKTLISIHTIDSTSPPFPVDAASLNCVLFRRKLFEDLKEVTDLWAVDQHGVFSIDNAFFLRIKEKGFKLYCDPRVICGHLGDPEIIDAKKWMEYSGKKMAQYDIKKQAELRKLKGSEARIYGELSRLADQHGTDKGSLDHTPDSGWYGWVHNYTPVYEAHFEPMRISAKKVMEIGVWHGSSMRLWRDYFPNAQIHGVDIDLTLVEGDPLGERVTLVKADAGNRQSLADLVEKTGSDWDLILDDGSHTMSDQQTALAVLFPHVRPGGWYVVEDLHTSFFPRPVINATTGDAEWPGDENPFGVKLDGSNATIHVLEALSLGKPIKSEYMTEEEMRYIEENTAECLIYAKKSMTCMIRKKG